MGRSIDHTPDPFHELHVLDVLCNVIEPVQEIPRIGQCRDRRLAKARRGPQPLLTARLHQDAVLRLPYAHRKRGAAAGARARARGDLNSQVFPVAQDLGSPAAAMKLCDQGVGHIERSERAVVELAIHSSDYNRPSIEGRARRVMKNRIHAALLLLALLIWTMVARLGQSRSAHAQAIATDTGLPAPAQAYVTNTFEEAINVRVGPSTIAHPVPCGALPVGATAEALGTTPAHEWVQIRFPECPGGVGWVYAINVTLTGALRVVESPPTPTPLTTATFDPTLVAAFSVEPTATRLPTFTPPPPLEIPTFAQASRPMARFASGPVILLAGAIGVLGLVASLVGRR